MLEWNKEMMELESRFGMAKILVRFEKQIAQLCFTQSPYSIIHMNF